MSILVYVLNISLLGGLVWWMQRQAWAKALQPYFYPALGLKLLCGVLLGLLYFEYYGGGDTIVYYQISTLAADIFREQGPGPFLRYLLFDDVVSERLLTYKGEHYMGAWNVIKLFSIPNLLAGGRYYLMVLYLALFSFSGMGYLTAQLMKRYPDAAPSAIVAMLFIPSVTFWSSGLLKESLVLGGMGYFLGAALALNDANRRKLIPHLLLLVSALALVWFIKYFIAAALSASLLVGGLANLFFRLEALAKLHRGTRLPLLVGLLLAAFWLVSHLDYNLQFDRLPGVVVDNYHKYLAISLQKPHVEFSNLEPSYPSLLAHAPLAILWILFRPFPWEATDSIHYVAAAENIILLALSMLSMYGLIRQRSLRADWIIISLWVFCLSLGVLLTYSMPNLGTLNRYRIVFLPFFVYLLCLNPLIAAGLQKLNAKITGR
ncbi:hypothetical protein MKJ04_22320 [Pontibacter sp. E15-1]|uniref:hypothetical protein n=1 Tax=Pontibacter sp. E15-1 TaxID=2919918 RepID=UPI001F4F7955|nr:hypothetical protein [Pontibacter sp. E15-1]MCJ8167595.1 hypothetical protein [Pontibacter sp. E15-1]